MSNWKTEFGEEYNVPSWVDTLGATDASWGNDACPHYALEVGPVWIRLWIEHPDPAKRDSGNPRRFLISVELTIETSDLIDLGEEWTGDDEDEAQRVFRDTLTTARSL